MNRVKGMRVLKSAFYNDSIQISFKELFSLLMGKEIKNSGVIIGLWRMPDNECPCDNCRKAIEGRS